MAEIIFGIDHGNGNMKGEKSVCFPVVVRYVSEPGDFYEIRSIFCNQED